MFSSLGLLMDRTHIAPCRGPGHLRALIRVTSSSGTARWFFWFFCLSGALNGSQFSMSSASFLGREIFPYLSHGLIVSNAKVYKYNKESHRKSLGLQTLGRGSLSDSFVSNRHFRK